MILCGVCGLEVAGADDPNHAACRKRCEESRRPRDGGPAFPTYATKGYGQPADAMAGMSLRDWFAGSAMQGVINNGGEKPDEVAKYAYEMADAILKAREW